MTEENRKEYEALKFTGEIITSPMKAIKAKCMDCVCDQRLEVQLCNITSCPIWPFREGKNPYRKGREFTSEQKQAARDRMAKARSKKN